LLVEDIKKIVIKNNRFVKTYRKVEEIQKYMFWKDIERWPGDSPEEKCYLKFNNLVPKKCACCGKQLPFISYAAGYGKRRFCSRSCVSKSIVHTPESVARMAASHKASMLAKYGVENAFQLESSIAAIQKKRRAEMDSIVEKMTRTNLARYGVKALLQDPKRYAEFSQQLMLKYGYKDYLSKLQSERLCEKEASGESRSILTKVEYMSARQSAVEQYRGYLSALKLARLECEDDIVDKLGSEAKFKCLKCGSEFSRVVDFKEVPICEACRSLSRSSPDAERADEISWLKSLGVADMQYNVKVGSVEYLAVSVSSKFYCKSFDEREIEENYRSVTDSNDYRSVISEASLHSRAVIDSEISAAVQEVRDKMGSLCYFSNLEWEQHREAVKTIVLRDLRKVDYIKYSDCSLDSVSKEEAAIFYRDNCIRDKKESDIAISIKRDGDVVAIVDLEYIDKVPYVDVVEKSGKKVVGLGSIVEEIKSRYGVSKLYEKRISRIEGKSLFGLMIKESKNGYDIYEN
jgi:hypothetical protein